MRYQEDFLLSEQNKKIIVHEWMPEEPVKGVLLVSHGLAEHGKRYEDMARYMTGNGYAVYAADHRAHGLTSEESLGVDDSSDTFHEIVKDMELLNRKAARAFPDVKRMLLGHSMGSFAAIRYAELFPDSIDGLVLSGSNGALNGAVLKAGTLLAKYKVRADGADSPGTLLNEMFFGMYNKKFKPSRTAFDWLSRDAVQVDRYVEDRFCGFVPSNGFFLSFFNNLGRTYDKQELSRIRKDLPVLILSGTEDPVGEMGKGPLKLAKLLSEDVGVKDLFVRLYKDSRHEILNEVNKEEVYRDLHTFLDRMVLEEKGE
ncbi:MAG TPA: alpha/beta hydrolase [Clostridiaceae bacterium]|nr:alpha/beta hydrolase [Clostridiaceae bacterium]